MTLSDIIERLEKAEGGSVDLDCEIALAVDGYEIKGLCFGRPAYCRRDAGGGWWHPESNPFELVREYTRSVDAAIALAEKVLPGRTWGFLPNFFKTHPYAASIGSVDKPNDLTEAVIEPGKTPALALCLAILKAKQMGVGE